MNDFTIALWTVAAAVLSFWIFQRLRKRSPPGPVLVPLLGIVPGIIADLKGHYVRIWSKRYNSNVIMVRMMGKRIVVVNSFDLIRSTLMRSDIIDRMGDVNLFRVIEPRHTGIVFTSGQVWKDARRVTIRRMRDFGASGSRAEAFIQREAEYLVKQIGEFNGEAFDPRPVLGKAVSNVLNQAMFGQRFNYDDAEFDHTLRCLNEFVSTASDPVSIYILSYKLGRLIFHNKLQRLRSLWTAIKKFTDEQIERHETSFDGSVNDLVDAMISDRQQGQGKFDRDDMRSIVIDMFAGGSDTTVIQLEWIIMYMAKYKDVQKRVLDELTDVNMEGYPTINNRLKTPYTEAMILEVMRLHPLAELGFPRTNDNDDFAIDGYEIDRGTPVLANLWSIHYDPEIFPDPDKFDPGHFLTSDGQLKNQNRMLSFVIGRRSCAGESLARVEIYLFVALLVMNFHIRAPDDAVLDFTPLHSNGANEARPFKIVMIPRA